jgi:hypothetical protein
MAGDSTPARSAFWPKAIHLLADCFFSVVKELARHWLAPRRSGFDFWVLSKLKTGFSEVGVAKRVARIALGREA